jgi:hypothetical protein
MKITAEFITPEHARIELRNMQTKDAREETLKYLEKDNSNAMALTIARHIEPHLIIEKEETIAQEIRRTELFVISKKQYMDIWNEMNTLLSTVNGIEREVMKNSFNKIVDIFHKQGLE